MKKLLILCLFSCFALQAEVEYDIIALAPKGEEVTTTSYQKEINESGYVWGSLDNGGPFVYHKSLGFKLLSIPEEFPAVRIKSINSKGLAVGEYRIEHKSENWWETSSFKEGVFIYDIHTDDCFDLLDHFGMSNVEGFALENTFIDLLTVTDSNLVIFSSVKYGSEPWSKAFVYNLDHRTASILSSQYPKQINSKGQMIGNSWFFDPLEGYQELESLDKFNRWKVEPEALSHNGVVAGLGKDSYSDEKGFIWSKDLGLQEFEPLGRYSYINGVNDKGQVIGESEVMSYEDGYSYSDEHAFLFCPEKGTIDLGLLGKGKRATPYSINNHSQVVGVSQISYYQERAFIWDENKGMRDLSTLIPKNTGWKTLYEATAITDAGLIIGHGSYYGIDQGFLLIPKKGK